MGGKDKPIKWDQKNLGKRKSAALVARKLRKSACEQCGTEKNLHAHHINRDWSDNRPENIQTLCATCHLKYHWSMGHIMEVGKRRCSVDGCDTISRRRGFCEKHFERMKKYGNPHQTWPTEKVPCIVCGKPYEAKKSRGNLCHIHRKVKHNHGDPFTKVRHFLKNRNNQTPQ